MEMSGHQNVCRADWLFAVSLLLPPQRSATFDLMSMREADGNACDVKGHRVILRYRSTWD